MKEKKRIDNKWSYRHVCIRKWKIKSLFVFCISKIFLKKNKKFIYFKLIFFMFLNYFDTGIKNKFKNNNYFNIFSSKKYFKKQLQSWYQSDLKERRIVDFSICITW
jgi:hypothetical protein